MDAHALYEGYFVYKDIVDADVSQDHFLFFWMNQMVETEA